MKLLKSLGFRSFSFTAISCNFSIWEHSWEHFGFEQTTRKRHCQGGFLLSFCCRPGFERVFPTERHGNDTAWQEIRCRFVVARAYGVIIRVANYITRGYKNE